MKWWLYILMNHVGEVYFLSFIRNSHLVFHLRFFKLLCKGQFPNLNFYFLFELFSSFRTNYEFDSWNFFFRARSFGKYLRWLLGENMKMVWWSPDLSPNGWESWAFQKFTLPGKRKTSFAICISWLPSTLLAPTFCF